jgi:predicted hydrocarbon binding protein
MTKVKGSKITSKLSYLKSTHGDGAQAHVLAWLSAEDREALGLVLEVGWYPQDLYVRLLTAICETVGGGDERIYTAIGEYSADHQFNHSYRVYRAGDIHETLQNMVPIHAKLNEPGGMEVEIKEPGKATLLVTAPPSDPVICAVSRGFYRRVMHLHGARDVQVVEPTCSGRGARSCRFEIQWTPVAAPSLDAMTPAGARRPLPPEMKHQD